MAVKVTMARVPQATGDGEAGAPRRRDMISPKAMATPATDPGPLTHISIQILMKAPEGAEPFANGVIARACVGQEHGQLGQGEGAAEGDEPTEPPEEVDLPGSLGHGGELPRGEEDARAEHVAHDDRGHGSEAELAAERGRRGVLGQGGRSISPIDGAY